MLVGNGLEVTISEGIQNIFNVTASNLHSSMYEWFVKCPKQFSENT